MLVRESESSRHRDNKGRKLQHDRYTGLWRITKILQTTIRGRKQRTRNVSTADVKPYHLRPLTLRDSLADEFAQYAWGPGFKLRLETVKTSTFDSLVSCRRVTSPSGTAR